MLSPPHKGASRDATRPGFMAKVQIPAAMTDSERFRSAPRTRADNRRQQFIREAVWRLAGSPGRTFTGLQAGRRARFGV